MNEIVNVRYFAPSIDLLPFIQSYWIIEASSFTNEHLHKEILPIGSPFIIFTLQGRAHAENLTYCEVNDAQNHVTGQITQALTLTYSQEYSFLAVIFQPDGLYHLLKTDVNSFTQSVHGTECVLGSDSRSISEEINQSVHHSEKIQVIENYIRAKLPSNLSHSDRVSGILELIQSDPTVPIDYICQYFSMSGRHLRREFKREIGIGPKLYLRIRRFQYAITLSQQNKDTTLQDLAFQCGYFDLSHFSNDFFSFAKQTPYFYLKKSQPHNDLGSMIIKDTLQ